jgi:ribosomal protein S27AE
MGRTYQFECGKCGYRVAVAGGASSGRHLAVQTIHCLDCRELYDAVTKLKVPVTPEPKLKRWQLKPTPFAAGPTDEKPPRFADALNRLVLGRGKRFHWQEYRLQCPVTAWHRVREWNEPGKCPKCGVFLDGGGTPFKVWD